MDIKKVLVETIDELCRMRSMIDARLQILRQAGDEMGCEIVSSSLSPAANGGGGGEIAAEITRQRQAIMAEVDKIRQNAMAQAANAQREASAASAGSSGFAPGVGAMGAIDGLGSLRGGVRLQSDLLKQIAERHGKKSNE
jgi:hypothetical protein